MAADVPAWGSGEILRTRHQRNADAQQRWDAAFAHDVSRGNAVFAQVGGRPDRDQAQRRGRRYWLATYRRFAGSHCQERPCGPQGGARTPFFSQTHPVNELLHGDGQQSATGTRFSLDAQVLRALSLEQMG